MRIFEELEDGKRGAIAITQKELARVLAADLAADYLLVQAQLAGLLPPYDVEALAEGLVIVGDIGPQFLPGD